MKYALLIYDREDTWEGISEDEQKAIYGEYFAIAESPGIYGGAELQSAQTATTVRVDNDRPLITDGPFAETKEVLGGFFLVDADNLDAALELARRVPAARMGGAVEVRPIVER